MRKLVEWIGVGFAFVCGLVAGLILWPIFSGLAMSLAVSWWSVGEKKKSKITDIAVIGFILMGMAGQLYYAAYILKGVFAR